MGRNYGNFASSYEFEEGHAVISVGKSWIMENEELFIKIGSKWIYEGDSLNESKPLSINGKIYVWRRYQRVLR